MGGSTQSKAIVYSKVLEGTEDDTHGAIRRHPTHEGLVETLHDGVTTLFENFQRGVSVNGDGPCLGWRVMKDGEAGPYTWMTYNEVDRRMRNYGAGLAHLELVPPNDDDLRLIAHFSKNRPEWVIGEQGCNARGFVVVPLYDTLGPDSVAYILNQGQIHTVLCSEVEVPKVIAAGADALKAIVQMEDVSDETRAAAEEAGLKIYSMAEVEKVGEENPQDIVPPEPDAVATFCYTSGTTGDPKGAMLTHRNIMADVAGAMMNGMFLRTDDVHISYLPLAHMFERIVQVAMLAEGGAIGFFQGNTLKLLEDVKVLRPTLFPSVPRLYNKIYDKILAGVKAAGGMKEFLFNQAFDSQLSILRGGDATTRSMWDGIVFGPLRKRLGFDRTRVMITGSAPIAAHVMDFVRVVFPVLFFEGYGQTESSAAATATVPAETSGGHVGGPLCCNEVRLEDVPDMGYLHSDTVHAADAETGYKGIACHGRGEVCYRGPNIFKGYYKMPEKTAETVDAEGWLHSGDIGLWLPNGALKIIDRKKNIFKLAQGEYVAAEKIENVYAKSNFVAQSFVYGDSLQSYLVGIVVPDPDYVKVWAAENGMEGKSHEEVVASDALRAALYHDLKRVGEEAKLRGFEKIKNFHLEPEVWAPGCPLLTPTFKLKRNVAKATYGDVIASLYEAGPWSPGTAAPAAAATTTTTKEESKEAEAAAEEVAAAEPATAEEADAAAADEGDKAAADEGDKAEAEGEEAS